MGFSYCLLPTLYCLPLGVEMPLEPVPFGGLRALEADELVPLEAALDATNCYVDDGSIRGRNGYRSVSGGSIGSGAAQGLWRFRPGPSAARSVAVQGGHIWSVVDPSGETAIDGAGADLGNPFGAAAKVSGAQLGQYLYLASDESAAIWRRVNASFALESVTAIAQPAAPSVSSGSLTLTTFGSLAAPTVAGGAVEAASGITNWRNISGTTGGTVIYDFGTNYDWSATNWLFIAASPESTNGGGSAFRIELATASGSFEQLAVMQTQDSAASASCLYASLQGLTTATRQAARRMRFTLLGPTTDPFSVCAFMPVPSAPQPGPSDYYVTYYNSSTGVESVLSPVTTVQYGDTSAIIFPQFEAARWYYNALQDLGLKSTNPDTMGNGGFLFNDMGGLTKPESSEFAPVKTFSGSCPAGTYDTVRLWRQCSNGLRLVKAQTPVTPGTTTYSIIDDTGDATLSHQLYKAGGTPPPCTAMAAVNGRIVCGGDPSNPNRVYISSYVAPNSQPSLFGSAGDPFPQFPAIPIIASDGWAFDIAPTAAEQVLWLGNGDRAAYIGTNEAMYVMTSLDPNSPPFKVFERGVIGRRAACWAESALFWAAHDGIYMAQNRAAVEELTQSIRRLYRATFAPDSTVVVLYQDRKLYAVRGTFMLRHDFVTGTWTQHTLNDTLAHGDDWRDPTGTYQQMWFQSSTGNLFRWQPGVSPTDANRATSDAGAAIPVWTYSSGFSLKTVYVMGFGAGEMKTRVRSIYLDTTGAPTASIYKDDTTAPSRSKTWSSGEHQLPFAPDLTAYKWRLGLTAANGVQVRRCLWEREMVSGEGA